MTPKKYIGDRTDLTAMEILTIKMAEIEGRNVGQPPMPGYTSDESCALLSLGNLRIIRDALSEEADALRDASGVILRHTADDMVAAPSATDELVDRFAAALKEKLRAAEQKYGFGNDWIKDDWRGELIAKLLNHVQKGDPRDVAAYCAFAWHHGWSITPYQHADPRRGIRELGLIATAEVDPKVREGIDRAIQHLKSMVEDDPTVSGHG